MRSVFPMSVAAAFVAGTVAASPLTAGTLQLFASGEDLATEGFQAPERTKDGWSLVFDHIFVTLADITAYQTSPPFEPQSDMPIMATDQVTVPGPVTVDLVTEADDEDRVLVAEVNAQPGHYNAIAWRMEVADSGPAEGTSMLLIGTATRGDQTVPFRIAVPEPLRYECGEYVGDERKGFVEAGGIADLEMTFHLDHVFGREDKDGDDPMNLDAPGFEPFSGGPDVYPLTMGNLHVGHAGEGHCRVVMP
jgi:hypothetical protein